MRIENDALDAAQSNDDVPIRGAETRAHRSCEPFLARGSAHRAGSTSQIVILGDYATFRIALFFGTSLRPWPVLESRSRCSRSGESPCILTLVDSRKYQNTNTGFIPRSSAIVEDLR